MRFSQMEEQSWRLEQRSAFHLPWERLRGLRNVYGPSPDLVCRAAGSPGRRGGIAVPGIFHEGRISARLTVLSQLAGRRRP